MSVLEIALLPLVLFTVAVVMGKFRYENGYSGYSLFIKKINFHFVSEITTFINFNLIKPTKSKTALS